MRSQSTVPLQFGSASPTVKNVNGKIKAGNTNDMKHRKKSSKKNCVDVLSNILKLPQKKPKQFQFLNGFLMFKPIVRLLLQEFLMALPKKLDQTSVI